MNIVLRRLLHTVIMDYNSSRLRNILIVILDFLIHFDKKEFLQNLSSKCTIHKKSRILIYLLVGVISILVLFFTLGVLTNKELLFLTKEKLSETLHQNKVKQKQVEILEGKIYNILLTGIDSREWMEKKVYQESGIRVPQTLDTKILGLMCTTADYYNIPYKYYFRMIAKESYYLTKYETSSAGAKYWAQITDDTFNTYAPKLYIDKHDIESNIRLSGLILYKQYKRFGNWGEAFAGYNIGPEKARLSLSTPGKYKGVKDYVDFIVRD